MRPDASTVLLLRLQGALKGLSSGSYHLLTLTGRTFWSNPAPTASSI